MGDMKTPDFDDLLAAFDIPDMDANEAIHSGPEEEEEEEEEEEQIKPATGDVASSEHGLPHADITTVSVIVKNTVCPEQLDALEGHGKDAQGPGPRLLQNGFNSPDIVRSSAPRSMESAASNGGENWAARVKGGKAIDLFTDFSPADNPNDSHTADLIDMPRDVKPKERQLFESPEPMVCPPTSVDTAVESSHSLTRGPPQSFGIGKTTADSVPLGLCMGASLIKEEPNDKTMGSPCVQRGDTANDTPLEHLKSVPVHYPTGESSIPSWPGPDQKPEVDANNIAPKKSPPNHKEDACLKNPPNPEPILEPLDAPQEAKISPVTEAPGVKEEPCWSPKSLSSDMDEEESVSSPSSNSSRPLKVRIKTIKTQSGSITRTVTRVSSDSDTVTSNQITEETSLDPVCETPPEKTTETKEALSQPPPKEKLDVSSPSKAEVSQVVKLQLGNGVKIKGSVLPVSTIQNASSVMLMAASVAQQKAVVMPSKTTKVLTKNIIHLVQQPLPNTSSLAHVGVTSLVSSSTITTTASPQRNATVVMVQSQKPSPAVAGTVISRTQSSLVETFNKILNSKNLLPTYKPNLSPPAESCLSLPLFGFRCLECGDSFALEKSLARHYDRRSMRIEVTCNHCTKRLVFFNKCSLLLHARKHKDNGLVMQCSHLVMRPIALEQMIGQPDVTPLVSVAVLTPGKAATPGPAQDAVATANGASDSAILPGNGTLEQAIYSTFRCLECKEQCKNKAGLAAHFQQAGGATPVASTVCTVCPMMMPNRCSFEAHQRMHKQCPPHVCPECGGNFRMENFQTHLKEACLHFSRRVGYRCPSCAVVFGGVNSIKSHIQTSHCEVFHKCPICPMAFKSAPSAHAHIYTQHPGFSNQQAKMIFKCAMCDTVFTHKPLLCSHFDQHLVNQRVSVFKCPDCPLLFAQKRTMLEHLKTTHNSQVKEDPPPPPPELLTPKQEPVETPVSKQPEPPPEPEPAAEPEPEESSSSDPPSSPEVRKKGKGRDLRKADGPRQRSNCWTCGICHSWFPERDEYVTHMKKEHGKSVKKFPCRLCERSFCSAPSLRRHVRVNHEGIKRVYPCRLVCVAAPRCRTGECSLHDLILTPCVPARPITPCLACRPALPFDAVTVLIAAPCVFPQGSSRKRKLSSDDSGSDEPYTAKPAPQKRKRSFQCRACGYKTRSLGDFRKHIPQHRTDESSHQCRECGVCFTSQGSLNRHRFMTHKMKGAEEDQEPPQRADPGKSSDGKLSCKVCGKGFDSQLNLKTHFRTHGMAFIKQRQSVGTEN
ncbi:zinc finger protein 687 [Ascaphus truei]|uniref:zinc finger protein 687 n=1 Tax=Ascaphus truei TaxID=8439 RepID=UPI003F597998